MSKPAPTFRPISSPLDVSDDALEKLVGELGVPSLVKPEQPPAPVAKPIVQPPQATPPSPSPRGDGKPARQSPLPAPDPAAAVLERISVDLPEYLYRAMRMRVAEEGTTMRFVVMQGLQAIGFMIDPCDFVADGRSTRPKTN